MGFSYVCPPWAPLLGVFGVVFALSLACIGSAYGTAKCGLGLFALGKVKPEKTLKCIIPVVMAGVVAIYGLIGSTVILSKITTNYSLYAAATHLAAGLTVGLTSLAAGLSVGIVGDAGVRAVGQQPKLYVTMVLILVFSEVLGLYGLVLSLMLANKTGDGA